MFVNTYRLLVIKSRKIGMGRGNSLNTGTKESPWNVAIINLGCAIGSATIMIVLCNQSRKRRTDEEKEV